MTSRVLLLVEDDEDDVFLLHEAFRVSSPDLQLIVVRDGREAVAYLHHEPPFDNQLENPFPDLVLTDIAMPNLDGFGLLRELRKSERTRYLLTCVYSASPRVQDVAHAYELGATLYFTKPTQYQELVSFAQSLTSLLPRMQVHPKLRPAG